ncbi:MAG: hypothetical protein ACR2OB_12740 [Solirubrobacteraceae bacterium]
MAAAADRRRGPLRLSAEGLLVAVVSVLCAAWVLRLWRADLTLPLRYTPLDDTKFYLMLAKGIIEHGWYLSNPSLGAPFGQHLQDYPQGADNLNLLIIRGLALCTSNPALVVNLFFLLTFALTSFTSYVVLSRLAVSGPPAAAASVLYSLLAYHFFRGETHLLLSAYYAVPLAAYLFLALLADVPLFARGVGSVAGGRNWAWMVRGRVVALMGGRVVAWVSARSLATLGLCVVIGSENLYYATFAEVLLAAATILALILRRTRTALHGLVVVALVGATLGANLAPSLTYRAGHGANPMIERSAAGDEASNQALALRVTNLVLPAPDSHIPFLRHLASSYDHAIAPGYCEACYASLGTVGTVGLGWLAVCGLGALAGATRWYGARRRLHHAGAGVAIALVVGSVGGLSTLFERIVTPDIRAWNRISVLIAFLSLLAVALLLDSLLGRLRALRWGTVISTTTLVGVLAFGVYDQSSDSSIPAYSVLAREYRSDGVFVQQIEARLPRGASVFQLPYVPFPEGYPATPRGDQVATYATKYEPLRGYLHSSALGWSYGAIKGRAADWSAQLAGQPLSFVVASVLAVGFDGIWVDPAGFEAGKAQQVRSALDSLLGAPLVSPDRDLWFYDLRSYGARLWRASGQAQLRWLGEEALHPLRTACARGGLTLINPSGAARPVTLTAHILAGGGRATMHRRLLLGPGRSFVRIANVSFATLTDDALTRFARGGGGLASKLVVGLTGPACAP